MVRIKVDTSEINQFRGETKALAVKFDKETSKFVKKSALNIKRGSMKNLTKNKSVKTGNLRRSINTNIRLFEAEIVAAPKYALGVEDGNRPHIIKPKKGKFLYWKGAKYPVKLVHHPGNKGKPYLVPAFEQETPILIKNLEGMIKW